MSLFSGLWIVLRGTVVRWVNFFYGSEDTSLENDGSAIEIFVRISGDKKIPLRVERDWEIRKVKESGLPPQHELIFQGRVLGDDVLVKDCNLGNQTVLDAVKLRSNPGSEPLTKTLKDLQLNPEERNKSQYKAKFYVYCIECSSLKYGKLRVRCGDCKSGAVILSRDPSSWEDVLIAEKISGSCGEKEVPVEFYFKCKETSHKEPSILPPLYLIKSNIKEVPCLACGDVLDPVIVFECKDRHVACTECFRTYCLSHLNERSFSLNKEIGYTLGCPLSCGESSLIRETKHFHLLGDEHYGRYQRFACEEYVLQNGGVLCPRPGCGMGILVDLKSRKVTCNIPEGCGYSFCRNCLQGYHVSPECPSVNVEEVAPVALNFESLDLAVSARWEVKQSLSIITDITKPCPQCRTPTERSGGCMHMICTRSGCGFNWCWICQDAWSRDCMGDHWFG